MKLQSGTPLKAKKPFSVSVLNKEEQEKHPFTWGEYPDFAGTDQSNLTVQKGELVLVQEANEKLQENDNNIKLSLKLVYRDKVVITELNAKQRAMLEKLLNGMFEEMSLDEERANQPKTDR